MACGTAWIIREAVACGQKFENAHYDHHCDDCANIGKPQCLQLCCHGIECHFRRKGKYGVVDEEHIGGTP